MITAARRVGAAFGIVAVLVAAPWLLWLLGRDVLPSSVPSAQDLIDALSRPDDGPLLAGVLLAAAVIVWAQLALSILAELVAVARGRPGVRVELPGLGASRLLASVLVAGLLGAGASTASAAPARPLMTVAAPAPAVSLSADTVRYPVKPRDTLWRIAEAELGDPLRWREIYALNVGVVQPDGGRLTEATLLHAGWTLDLPTTVGRAVVVRPGDTLSGIAARDLHDAGLAEELFAANEGHPQGDGHSLGDPDMILPGWMIRLPATAGGAAPAGPTPGSVPTVPGPATPPLRTTAPAAAQPPASTSPATPTPSAAACPTPAATSPPAASTSAEIPPPSAPIATDPAPETPGAPLPALISVSSLVVTGLVGALAVRRRRQLRHRHPRHRIAVPDDATGRMEWEATHATPTLDAAFLDAALRGLTLHDWTGTTQPDLAAVDLGTKDARLTIASDGRLPAPFEADEIRWTLAADADLPLPPGEAGGRCAPFPVLASMARSPDDRALLLDLEALGVAHLTGDPDAAVGLMRHIAADLANARCSEDVEIILVGFGHELLPLNPERLRSMPDIASGLAEIRSHIRRVGSALRTTGVSTVVGGRLAEVAPDAWLPVVLLADGGAPVTDADRAELRMIATELDEGGRRGVAVLVHDIELAGTEIHIAADGELVTRTAFGGPWTAERVTTATAAGLAGILAPTAAPDLPVGPATHPDLWAADMDADGALTTEEDREADRRLEIVEHQDPTLDDDLARWSADGEPAVPLIGILGEPTVRAPGALPSTRTSWVTEVLVYLALHPGGVTLQKVLADLWPEGQRVTLNTARHAVYVARRWAGRGLDGDPELAFVSDIQSGNTYRLRGHLLDWDLFRRLRKRAQARHTAGHPGAADDYRAALGLIRGPVLSALRPDGYAWLASHDQRHDLQIPGFLVDAAHELVDLALADDDTALARWAAETAREVDTDAAFDRPLTDLMRVAHAEDRTSELERYAAILLDARGFDVPEELPPETFAVLNRLLPAGPRRRDDH